jgi:hypothetical protein
MKDKYDKIVEKITISCGLDFKILENYATMVAMWLQKMMLPGLKLGERNPINCF